MFQLSDELRLGPIISIGSAPKQGTSLLPSALVFVETRKASTGNQGRFGKLNVCIRRSEEFENAFQNIIRIKDRSNCPKKYLHICISC